VRHRRHGGPRRGYVLVLVLGALALIALVAGRFAQRIDELRAQAGTLSAHAQAQLEIGNATAAMLYFASTRTLGPGGFGPVAQPLLLADDRPYRLADGAEVQVQDARGLLALNASDRVSLLRVLSALGVGPREADALTDTLHDYTDVDSLLRLNGAEAPQYAELGLPPPRNDWLVSPRELARLPQWRDRAELIETLVPMSSTVLQSVLNPNTAPLPLLRALRPDVAVPQWELFDTLRRRLPFASAAAAGAATGLRFDGEQFVFFVGAQHRITVWPAAGPRGLQYNLVLTPSGPLAPWLITEIHSVQRPRRSDDTERASPFPLDLSASTESRSQSAPSEQRRPSIDW
jgi:general secretion pathway protein K